MGEPVEHMIEISATDFQEAINAADAMAGDAMVPGSEYNALPSTPA